MANNLLYMLLSINSTSSYDHNKPAGPARNVGGFYYL